MTWWEAFQEISKAAINLEVMGIRSIERKSIRSWRMEKVGRQDDTNVGEES